MSVEQMFTRKRARWIYASVLVIAGIGLAACAIIYFRVRDASFPAIAIFLVCCVLVTVGISLVREPKPSDRIAQELEAKGLLHSRNYRARRAFRVEQPNGTFEHFGPHYFIELQDGRVLHLNGDYLDFYEPRTWSAPSQPRRFPCTEFTIRRHKWDEHLIDILCGGEVLEPEVNAPAFQEWEAGQVPYDEEIIENKTYAELKAERLETR